MATSPGDRNGVWLVARSCNKESASTAVSHAVSTKHHSSIAANTRLVMNLQQHQDREEAIGTHSKQMGRCVLSFESTPQI
jgi:hypothetical protein